MSSQDDGVKEVGEVVSPSVAPTDESGKDFYSDIPEPTEEPIEPQEVEEVAEEKNEQESGKNANARIRELNSKANAEKERADSLAKQVEELTATSQMPNYDFGPMPQNDSGEITAEELEARAVQKAVAISNIQFHQQQNALRIQQEANASMSLHPELDPDSDVYDADLSQDIIEDVLAHVRLNPTKSLKTYIDKRMARYKSSVAKEVGNLADTVTRQAAEKALRPTSTPKGEKRVEDMSEKELEERLGMIY
jgi:hypothetical protein